MFGITCKSDSRTIVQTNKVVFMLLLKSYFDHYDISYNMAIRAKNK